MLIRNNQLSEKQLTDLLQLRQTCHIVDHQKIPVYDHLLLQKREWSLNFLYYHHDALVGFLSAFHFYEDAFEVMLLVAPSFRKQGLATELFKNLVLALKNEAYDRFIFSLPHDTGHWLIEKGFNYLYSEFELTLSINKPKTQTSKLIIRQAKEEDLKALTHIDSACFHYQIETLQERFIQLLHNPEYTLLIALDNKKVPVGKAHLHWQGRCVRLSDIAILPEYQGKGYGRALLLNCLQHAYKKEIFSAVLDVEATNQTALKLYTNAGFEIVNACDYWEISRKLTLPLFEQK